MSENVPLAPLTTFSIGGPARYFARVASLAELQHALAFAREHELPLFILGGGSNVLIDDAGFAGLVIKMEIRGIEEQKDPNGSTLLIGGAGEPWDAFVAYAVERGLWGIENLSGIPGTIGGAVVQDIGAYGAALSQTLRYAQVLDTRDNSVRNLTRDECAFGYRESIFKREEGRYIVLGAALALSDAQQPNFSYADPSRLYKDLARRFAGTTPTLPEIRAAILDIRRDKFPDLAVLGTAGSFFKNPVVPKAEAERLRARYGELPLFSLPESDNIKVPLGWLLDYRHGVIDIRGLAVGGARMFEKHFLVAVAERGTAAADVRALARAVQEKVFDACAIKIEPEVKII